MSLIGRLVSLVIIEVFIALTVLVQFSALDEFMRHFLTYIIMILLGIYGNCLYSYSLTKQGYKLSNIICAGSLDQAKQRFFDKSSQII